MLTPDEQAMLQALQAKAAEPADIESPEAATVALINAQTEAEIRLIRERAKARERELLAAAEADLMRTMTAGDVAAQVIDAEAAVIAEHEAAEYAEAAEHEAPELVIINPIEPGDDPHAEPDGNEMLATITELDADDMAPVNPDAAPAQTHWLFRPMGRRR